ncbi:MAG: single-stranded-DNA-specific exonuclease RecJ [Patescibacteria group bacterium]
MKKVWKLEESYPRSLDKEFSDFDELTRQLLWRRGIKTSGDAQKFLNPDYGSLCDPFLIKNMDRAVGRVLEAVAKKEKIIICGDYDADGVCSSSIIAEFFRTVNYENYEIYIPDRFKEGYGFTDKSADFVFSRQANLVLTVDNGISNYGEIESVQKKGIDVVVLDHHIVPEKIPPAWAVVDLYQKGEKYPFLDFCGSGLAFKFISALLAKGSFGLANGWEKWLLDLVAIGTVADNVALLGENRTMVYWGLKVLGKNRRPGIRSIAAKAGLNLSKIISEDIAFLLAPRINVAGRLDHATLAGQLLLTESADEAEWLAGHLEEKNKERKEAMEKIVKFIQSDLAVKALPEVLVYGNLNWHPGVLGAACSRLAESFSRTVVLWGKGESREIKASVRGDGRVNVLELVKKAGEEMYSDAGGHPMAAGFSIKEEYLDQLEKRILDAFKKMPQEENIYSRLVLEKELLLDEASRKMVEIISRFEPFGQGNPKPVFLFKNLKVEGVRTFGNGGPHLEFTFKNLANEIIPAIGFWTSNGVSPVNKGDKIDLAASLEISNFKSRDELRLRIADFKKV